MRGSPSPPAPRVAVIALAALAAVLTAAAAGMMFSTFMFYDDEGYILLSLKNFATNGGLYREVYSQYGPFPYTLYSALHALGMPLTHGAGRLLTLAAWSGAALSGTVLVWRTTRNFIAALATLTATFVYLWIMVSEPSHPGGLVTLLTAVLAAYGSSRLAAGRDDAWALAAGAGVATLLLTKINVGVFAAISFGVVALLHHRNIRLRGLAPWLLGLGFVILPFALMRPLLHVPWVQTYAVVFALSAVAAVAAAKRGAMARLGARHFALATLGAGVVLLVVLGYLLVRGSSAADLLEGMILGPLRHPASFSLMHRWPGWIIPCTVASLALLGLAWWRGDQADLSVAIARLVVAGGLVTQIARFPLTSPDSGVFGWALPALWLFLWPLSGRTSGPATSWVAFLFLGQSLHAFPVPGSQIAWGTFLAIPITALGTWEAAGWLATRWPQPRGVMMALRVALVAFAIVPGARLAEVGQRALHSRPLGLPGAMQLRLPDGSVARYRLLALNAIVHSDMLFSLPGMFSFNLWTGLPTPTLANVTHWFSLLNAERQEAIIRALDAHPRAAVIVQPDHLEFLRVRGFQARGPLYDYVMREFSTAFAIDGFDFRIRNGRRIVAFQTAEVLERPSGAEARTPDTLLKIDVLLTPGQNVTGIEIIPTDGGPGEPWVFQPGRDRLEITRLNAQGEALGHLVAQTLPFTASGPMQLAVYFDRGATRLSLSRTLIIIRGAAGEELALVRLRP